MPIYEYKCQKCGHAFDYFARTLSDKAGKCPKCGARNPQKQLSTFSPAVASGSASCPTGTCPTATCPTGTCSLG